MRENGHTLALALFRAASSAFSWIAIRGPALALLLLSRLAVSSSWIRVNGHTLALALLRAASSTFSRIATRSRVLALLLLSRLAVSLSWTGIKAHALALALLNAASVISPWIRAKVGDIAAAYLTLSTAARSLPRRFQTALAGKLSRKTRSRVDDLKRSALTTKRSLLARISGQRGSAVDVASVPETSRSPVVPQSQAAGDELRAEEGVQ
jgi:hypothetical protein